MTAPVRPDRRAALSAGLWGLTAVGLDGVLRARAAAGTDPGTACVLVWLGGGPSHLETYDLKPDAPAEYRGEFRPIRTNVPGLDVCELLPLHAGIADKFALVRSLHHEFSGHWDGSQHFLTGRPAVLTGGGTPTSVYPELGSVVKKLLPAPASGLPGYVAVLNAPENVGPAYLGKGYEPFVAGGDPKEPGYRVPDLRVTAEYAPRLDDRRALLRQFDRVNRAIDARGALAGLDQFQSDAVRLLTGEAARRAFDLSAEPAALRDRYGRTTHGQSLLLARRLVEAGVPYVYVDASSFREALEGGWDDHASMKYHIFDRMRKRLPVYDRGLTALIGDVSARGLARRVMVVAAGEFGRTPRVDVKDGVPGRDHHPGAQTVLVAGGGCRGGQVVGSTDDRGAAPKDRPLRPADLLATVYRHLGVDARAEFPDHTGRPMAALPDGESVRELTG